MGTFLVGLGGPREAIMSGTERTSAPDPHLDDIHDAIQAVREKPLRGWVAVAIWDDTGETTVLGDDTPLNLKGFLHSGLWEAAHPAEGEPAESRTLASATDVRKFDKGHMDVVRVGGTSIGRGVFEPGFRWSECIKPIVGTESCQLAHVGYVLAGRMKVVMDNGDELEIKQGQAIHVAPGHDAWTLGDEDCVVLEVQGAEEFAIAD
jgi:hypothetical protein